MNSGNRTVSILSTLAASLTLATGDARAPEASDRIAVAFAPARPLQSPEPGLECVAAGMQRAGFRFEMISSEPDAAAIRELHQGQSQRAVGFDWNPRTGELTLHPRAAFRLPEYPGLAVAIPTTGSCESR